MKRENKSLFQSKNEPGEAGGRWLRKLLSGFVLETSVAAVGAVGMWESRALCGISQGCGKPGLGFPQPVISTALPPSRATG